MPRIAAGSRDETGRWTPDDPSQYPRLDVHGIWPWSVLDQNSEAWRKRRTWWDGLGVDDTHTRDSRARPAMISTGRHGRTSGGLSKFDPVLAELCYTWYCPDGTASHPVRVFDPFSGGPVRGLIAARMGLIYHGIDLLSQQVADDEAAASRWRRDGLLQEMPEWTAADAAAHLPRIGSGSMDYMLTCPPYHNRERYSDDPRDLSVMRWREFLEKLAFIMGECGRILAEDRFCTVVISDVRDHRGHLRGLPTHLVRQMQDAGLNLINEQILVEKPGLRAKTTRPPWEAARTTTRRHQIALTFVKGDRKKAARNLIVRAKLPHDPWELMC